MLMVNFLWESSEEFFNAENGMEWIRLNDVFMIAIISMIHCILRILCVLMYHPVPTWADQTVIYNKIVIIIIHSTPLISP